MFKDSYLFGSNFARNLQFCLNVSRMSCDGCATNVACDMNKSKEMRTLVNVFRHVGKSLLNIVCNLVLQIEILA